MAGPYPSDGDVIVRRGEVWWVDFDTVDGGEIRKMRPAVVVTADALNRARRTVVVVPLATGPQPRPPIVVATPSAGDGRVAVCDQARAVDKAPVSGPLSGAQDLARITVEGEAIGYDYCTLSDHVVIPRELEAKYPYSDTGEFPGRAGGDRHEQLTAVTFVAAKTSKLRLVTSVMVVPHRPAVLTAKILATIDVLSGGRLTLGIGAGWCREEFEAIGTDPFDERGAVTDEYLLACRELWTNADPHFDGKYVKFANVFFN